MVCKSKSKWNAFFSCTYLNGWQWQQTGLRLDLLNAASSNQSQINNSLFSLIHPSLLYPSLISVFCTAWSIPQLRGKWTQAAGTHVTPRRNWMEFPLFLSILSIVFYADKRWQNTPTPPAPEWSRSGPIDLQSSSALIWSLKDSADKRR